MYEYKLKSLTESYGIEQTKTTLTEAIQQKKIDPYAIRFPALVEAFLGRDYFSAERKLKAISQGRTHLLEASEANDASAFSNITGQLLVTIIKEKYDSPEFIGSQLVRTVPNPGANLKEHKVPYLSDVLTKGETLSQGETYPYAQFAESWYEMPAPIKSGQLCAVTMEALFSDLTGQIQDSAASIGQALGYLKEERILRVVLGITNPYKWNGNALSTYVSTENAGKYVNRLASTTITNYTHINSMEQLFWQMRDPITERRIYVRPSRIICAPEKRYELKRILNATEVRTGDITSGDGTQTVGGNPLDNNYGDPLSSPIARALLAEAGLNATQIKERVYFGDYQKAFGYREVFGLKVEEAPALNPDEFKNDIAMTVKASEYGVTFVIDPRYAGLATSES